MQRHLLTVLAVIALVVVAGCGGPISGESTTEPTPDSPSVTQDGPATSPNGTISIHFINVGQGSSTLLVGPTNQTMLIDSGDWSDDGEHVVSSLRKLNIERIDHLVTTHADADHIGGHEAVIDYLETEGNGVGAVYDPGIPSTSQTYQEYLDAIEEHNVTLYETRAGDRIPFEGVETDVLAPPAASLANGDRNENSIVLRLEFGHASFLLPGDGETASEQYLVDEYRSALNVTVLNAGHHGSRSSSGAEFLNVTRPRIAVISSSYDSQYGHPHEEVLQRFAQRSIQTYWTATHGNIQLTSNGSAITVATQYDAPTTPLEIRDGDPVAPGSSGTMEVRTVIPVKSPALPDGGTTDPERQQGTLSVATVHEDAAGNDNTNLNDEYIVFENTGDQPLELSNWSISDEAGHTYTFPSGFTLAPGSQVTLHTGSGTDSSSDRYWGSGSAIWNNAGDTIIVADDSGTVVLQEEYS